MAKIIVCPVYEEYPRKFSVVKNGKNEFVGYAAGSEQAMRYFGLNDNVDWRQRIHPTKEDALAAWKEERPKSIIITRHQALVDLIRQDFPKIDDVEVHTHAAPDVVRGNVVYGVLPMNLAALASYVVTPDLRIPPELRGQELDLEQLKSVFHGWKAYRVREIDLD